MAANYRLFHIHILSVLRNLYTLLQAQIHCTTGFDTSLQVQTLQGSTVFYIPSTRLKNSFSIRQKVLYDGI